MRADIDQIIARRKDLTPEGAITKASRVPSSWSADKRTARFVMSAQSVDRMGDIVVTEGIDTSEFEANPVALLFHQSRKWPVGSWANLEKNTTGRPKRLEGDLVLLPGGGPVKEIDEAEWMLANGGIKGASIGFVPDWKAAELIKDESGDWTGGIRWNLSKLVECSVVPVPANPDALVRAADGNMRLAKEFVEEVLDTWAKTPDGLLVPRSEYEKTYKILSLAVETGKIADPPQTDPPLHPSPESAVTPKDATADILRLRLRRMGL